MNEPKVFCIGWHKTGTTTLGDALLILGYKVMGARLDLSEYLLEGNISKAIEASQGFNAFQDVPWNVLYKELDKAHPNSKFILTTRDENEWLLSAQKHFKDSDTPMRKWIYGQGAILGNEELYLTRYKNHYKDVFDYFKNRESDILVLDLSEGEIWNKLCSFLNKPVPNKPFPHSNKGKHRKSKSENVIDFFKKLIPDPVRKIRLRALSLLGYKDPRYRFNNRHFHEEYRVKNKINEPKK